MIAEGEGSAWRRDEFFVAERFRDCDSEDRGDLRRGSL